MIIVSRVSEDVKILAKEMRDIDKRVVRLETFIEIAKEKSNTLKMLMTED